MIDIKIKLYSLSLVFLFLCNCQSKEDGQILVNAKCMYQENLLFVKIEIKNTTDEELILTNNFKGRYEPLVILDAQGNVLAKHGCWDLASVRPEDLEFNVYLSSGTSQEILLHVKTEHDKIIDLDNLIFQVFLHNGRQWSFFSGEVVALEDNQLEE